MENHGCQAAEEKGQAMTLPSEAGEGLKACPFCGGEAPVWGRTWWAVKCRTCAFGRDNFLTRETAIDHWNRRVPPTGIRELTDEECDRIAASAAGQLIGFYWAESARLNPPKIDDALDHANGRMALVNRKCRDVVRAIASALHQQGGKE